MYYLIKTIAHLALLNRFTFLHLLLQLPQIKFPQMAAFRLPQNR